MDCLLYTSDAADEHGCVDYLKNKESINKLIEVTSSNDNKKISFKKAMQFI